MLNLPYSCASWRCCSLSVIRQSPELHTSPSIPLLWTRQVPCLNQSLDGFPSDGYVDGLLFCFVILRTSRWCIIDRSCRHASSSKSNVTSAVMSQIKPAFGYGHQEGFMSSHMVTKLVFKGPSQEPQSKLTCPFSSKTEGSTTRSSKQFPAWVVPSSTCQFPWLAQPRNQVLQLAHSRSTIPGFLIHEGILCYPWNARYILKQHQLLQCCIVFLSPDCFS